MASEATRDAAAKMITAVRDYVARKFDPITRRLGEIETRVSVLSMLLSHGDSAKDMQEMEALVREVRAATAKANALEARVKLLEQK